MNLSRTVLRERGFRRDTVQMLQLPALSKEINKMMKEGLVIMEGKRIEILDKTTLEKYL